MPRGQPDFGSMAPTVKASGGSDMAELAARLGSIVTYDRRGKIVLLDDFESPVLKCDKWGVYGSAVLDFTYPKSGSQCVKLSLQDNALAQYLFRKRLSYISSPRLGAEISFVKPPSGSYLRLALTRLVNNRSYYGWVRFDFATGAIAYYSDIDTWMDFVTGLNETLEAWHYHTTKLVVDFNTNKYVRFLYAGQEYDLSSYAIPDQSTVAANYFAAQVWLKPKVQAAYDIYLDDFILTEEEP
jgi:hypothetical protein